MIEEDRERLSRAAGQAIENHEKYNIEFRIIRSPGDLRWLYNLGSVEYDADGKPVRVIGTVQDITERKSAESLVRESERNYRARSRLRRHSRGRSMRADRHLTHLSGSRQLSGREVKTVEDLVDVIHPDDIHGLRKEWQLAIDNRSVFSTVARFRSSDDSFRFLALRGVQVFNDDGTLSRWIGTLNDITARKSAEDELRRSEAFNRAVLDSMTANIAVLDNVGRVRTLNRSWREFVLESPDLPAESQFRVEIGADYPEASERGASLLSEGSGDAAEGIRNVLNGKEGDYSEEFCIKMSGVSRWFYMLVSPLKTREGGAVVSHTEISSLKAAEEALKKHQTQLQLVADTVPTVVAHLDKSCKFLFVNEACRKWFQVSSKDEIIGHHMREVMSDEIYERVRLEIASVLRGNTIKLERNAIRDPSRYVYVTYVPDLTDENEINGFFFFLVDLTENNVPKSDSEKARNNFARRKSLSRSAVLPAASRMISITCSPPSLGIAN